MNEFLTGSICVEVNWIPFFFSPTYEYFCAFAAKSYATSISLISIPSHFDESTLDNTDRSAIITSVCANIFKKIEIYKSRNNVKVWERKKKKKRKKIKYRCNSYCLDFIFFAIVNQLQNDLFSFQINLQTWHVAFLQIFKKGSRSSRSKFNPRAIFSFPRSNAFNFIRICVHFLSISISVSRKGEREKERLSRRINENERKINAYRNRAMLLSQTLLEQQRSLASRCSRTRFDKRLHCQSVQSSRGEREVGVLYIDGAQEHNRIMLSRRVHNDNVYHAAIQQLAYEKYRSIKGID